MGALVWSGLTPTAEAGGLEFPAAGSTALGRGGAMFARPGDPMALYYNPANLAASQGIQLSLQTHLALYEACHRRGGTYVSHEGTPTAEADTPDPARDPDQRVIPGNEFNPSAFNPDTDGDLLADMPVPDTAMPEVCNSGPPGVVPELVLTWRAHEMVGIGIGFLTPAAVGHTVWGNDQRVGDRTYRGIQDGLPAPTRYNLIEEQLIAAWPTIGIGVAPHPRIRFGASMGFGFALVDFQSIVRATRGEDFTGDVFSELSVSDSFIPKITASVHAVPHDNLDVSLTFIWTDDIRADGDLTLTSGYYRAEPLEELKIDGVELEVSQPWQLAFGLRYADRIAPRPRNPDDVSRLSGRVEDPMANERFDIELNVVYERNSRVDDFNVNLPTNPDPSSNGLWTILADTGIPASIPPSLRLPHNWQDQLSVRLGADYNIMPGLAAIRVGFSFETKGIEDGYEQIDFLPFMRFGGHIGLTMRVGMFDLTLAYAHIHQFEATVSEEEARVRQVNADSRIQEICRGGGGEVPDELCSSDGTSNFGEGTVINTGRFTSNFDVVSLGLTYHFR
ncbi:MAG: hypothetical protein CMN29_04755 [Sandaracinus sp.]|nr:hypothetical protein [Sandaracinus sp.]